MKLWKDELDHRMEISLSVFGRMVVYLLLLLYLANQSRLGLLDNRLGEELRHLVSRFFELPLLFEAQIALCTLSRELALTTRLFQLFTLAWDDP